MTKEEFLKKLEEDEEFSPGWQVIDDAFEALCPEQKPAHYATDFHSRAICGGDNFLDGYSIYQSPKGYKHIVTYGMTESELNAVMDDYEYIEKLIKLMKEDGNPNLVTDMMRTKSYL